MINRLLLIVAAAALGHDPSVGVGTGAVGFEASGHQAVHSASPGGTATSSPPARTHTTYTACEGDGACPTFTCPPGQDRVYYETEDLTTPLLTGTSG